MMQQNHISMNQSDDINSFVIDNIPLGVIKKSTIHGYGLFAGQRICIETVLVSLDGQIVPWELYISHHNVPQDAVGEWNALAGEKLLIRSMRTKYWFINHSRKPNCAVINRQGSLHVLAITDIPAGHELTLDYRLEPLPAEYVSKVGVMYL